MNQERRKQQILNILAAGIRRVVEAEHLDYDKLQEIRLRIKQPLLILYDGEERFLPAEQKQKHIVTKAEIKETLEYSSHYSLYAYEHEIRQGFLTVEGGHRVGVAGKAILEQEKVKSMQYISSVNIRMSHEIPGCADGLLPMITKNREVCHTLIISPPCGGKTTLLRDLIRQISDGNSHVKGCTVGVVDERSEIGGCYLGVAQNQLGSRTDILDCCPKAEGMIMLIRSMAPRVLAVDEIGAQEELRAVEYAMQCGCKLIASVHGNSMEEIAAKPGLSELVKRRRFERYVVLQNQRHPGEIKEIYDERGSLLCRN
ncbi:MAG: stage III sporulation protein AA [[Ruminococcus] gnavus]|nr:stage III sporulation protein AA [Mediterraneibacter gnavus]